MLNSPRTFDRPGRQQFYFEDDGRMLVDDTTPDGRYADVDGKLLDHNPYEDETAAEDETDAAEDETEADTEEETTGSSEKESAAASVKETTAAVKETVESTKANPQPTQADRKYQLAIRHAVDHVEKYAASLLA